MNRRSHRAGLLTAAVLAVTTTACSHSTSAPRPKEADLALDARVRAHVILTQIAMDTEGSDFGSLNLTEGVLVDGVVTASPGFVSWYGVGQNLKLSKTSTVRIMEEADKATAALRRLSRLQSAQDRKHHVPALTTDEVTHLIIVHELIDAGYLTAADVSSMPVMNFDIQPGSELDNWYAAHADRPLRPGASVTLATEASRVAAEIDKPEP